MIPKQWQVDMDSTQVRDKPVGVVRMGEKLVFWWDSSGKVACLRDSCTPRGVQLSKGKIIRDHFQCRFHDFEYDHSGKVTIIMSNGKNTIVPERFQILSFPAYEGHSYIWIRWGENPPKNLQLPEFFKDIDDSLPYSRTYDYWNTNYSRVIENQLDAAHLPFVHYNTIGQRNRTLVDGPVFQWLDGDKFYIFVRNRVADGNSPRKPEQMPALDPNKDFKLKFIFPNLWQNYIGEELRIIIAFVPVDQENTILYLLFYQHFMRISILRQIITRLFMPYNLIITHQDRRVVVMQQPKPSALHIGEQLFQANRPIIEYQRRRQQLLEKAHQ